MVMFIYRPEYYGLTETEDGAPVNDLAEIIIAKNRNGALKSVPLRFIGRLTKFTDYETYDFMDQSGSDDQPMQMVPNPNVDSSRITRNSRMNDMEDQPF